MMVGGGGGGWEQWQLKVDCYYWGFGSEDLGFWVPASVGWWRSTKGVDRGLVADGGGRRS